MSTISNRHSIIKFDPKVSKALDGQRLAKIGYKTTKKTPAKFPSVCVSVPAQFEITDEEFESLMPHVAAMLQTAQDGIVRSLYESSNGILSSVSDEEISVSSCISFLESEAHGDRLTKEYLEGWFSAQIADNLTVVICEKLGVEDTENQKVLAAVKQYKGLISALSGGATFYSAPKREAIKQAIALSTEEDDTAKKLLARIAKMESNKEEELVLAL